MSDHRITDSRGARQGTRNILCTFLSLIDPLGASEGESVCAW